MRFSVTKENAGSENIWRENLWKIREIKPRRRRALVARISFKASPLRHGVGKRYKAYFNRFAALEKVRKTIFG